MPRALVAFHAAGRFLAEGDIVSADDPILSGREHLFEADASGVEEATANPGARRRTTRAKAKD